MQISKRLGVRSVLVLQVGIPVMLVLAVTVGVALSILTHFTESRLQRNLRILAEAVSLPLSEALSREDIEQAETSLASVFEVSDVYGAYLLDQNGDRIASFGSVNPSQSQSIEAIRQTEDGEFAQYERIDGRNVYSFFLPLFEPTGQPSGLLQITRRRSDIEGELNQLRIWAWSGYTLVSLIILATIALAHNRSIGRPISSLSSSMLRVEQGDRAHRATPSGPAEIRKLGLGLNGVLDAIQEAEQRARQQQAEREQMADRLRQTETLAALGQLSAGVAHELGAPLNVVDGRARRALRQARTKQQKRELEGIREQAGRMTSIVQQLLTFGRRSQGDHVPVSVMEWVTQVRTRVLEEYPEARIALAGTPPATIEGDLLGLEQALLNLVRNGLQANPGGTVTIGWYNETEDPDTLYGLTVYVEDNGPGLDQSGTDELFTPFFTTKEPGEGTGLGLAIARRVMREHHGDVLAVSSRQGARFELRFPADRTVVSDDAPGD